MQKLTTRTRVPLWGTISSGVIAGTIAFFIDINTLAEMISMGTLMAFTLVCSGIIILRVHNPMHQSYSTRLVTGFIAMALLFGFLVRFQVHPAIIGIMGAFLLVPVVLLGRLPRHAPENSYSAPFVPYLPLFGIFCNVYLIASNQVGWRGGGNIESSYYRCWYLHILICMCYYLQYKYFLSFFDISPLCFPLSLSSPCHICG